MVVLFFFKQKTAYEMRISDWSSDVCSSDLAAPPDYRMRLVRGSHIVVRRLFDHDYAYFFQLPDGRIFFAIPYERVFTLIGTTDADHEGSLADIPTRDEEIAYLCEGANLYFRTQIDRRGVGEGKSVAGRVD